MTLSGKFAYQSIIQFKPITSWYKIERDLYGVENKSFDLLAIKPKNISPIKKTLITASL